MASLSALLAVGLMAASGSAQQSEHVWSAVGYVFHGERTPFYSPYSPTLTSLGAQQMYAQGDMFRTRYLEESITAGIDREAGIHRAHIVDISKNTIDNSQIDILTTADSYNFASAMAFLQGLYPPIEQASGVGGMDGITVANGSLVNYPVGGYQYPNIKTSSVLDPDSIWTEGHTGCSKYTESLIDFRDDADVVANYNSSLNFYRSMWQQLFRDAGIDQAMANYHNAYTLYDYALYNYNHNTDNDTRITHDELKTLASLAASQQRSRNANPTASGSTSDDRIRAIAGRTLAAKVLGWFNQNIRTQGSSNKLSLAFTDIEPFIAFFSLARLTKTPSGASFLALPNPGAAMVFELFSAGGNQSEYPSMDDLWVRFLYRNGVDTDEDLVLYPLFGNGNSRTRIQFSEFIQGVQDIDVSSVAEWCRTCDSISIFCLRMDENSGGGYGDPSKFYGGGRRKGAVSPPVAGVIGAVVTAAVIGLAFLALFFLGCLRVRRVNDATGRNSSLGGFKGAEKMASDVDIAHIGGTGSRHERTGSWELRGGGGGATKNGGGPSTVVEEPVSPLSPAGATFQPGRLRSSLDNRPDDDAVSEMGHTPTKPREF